MAEAKPMRSLPKLRRYLLAWIVGFAVLMVFAYTQLLDYYLGLGIDLRTKSMLERTAQQYVVRSSEDGSAVLPAGPSVFGYRSLDQIPPQILALFATNRIKEGELLRYTNVDLDGDNEPVRVDTLELCPEGLCDLIFLYTYNLGDNERLFLVHGTWGSDAIFDELEFTERVAFAIGSLFAALFLLASFLVIRSIDGPLGALDRWSAALGSDDASLPVPDLTFHEFDALARRLQVSMQRVQEGVQKEKLFLRHASHELRTPLAILSANVELLDKLSSRPERSSAEQASFDRQYRALDEVKQLVETLLWVNRQSEHPPTPERVDLTQEVDALVQQLQFLLEGRSVTCSIHGGDQYITQPAAAVRIVLSNLIRNAFQYTVDGEVSIILESAAVSVSNQGAGDVDPANAIQSDEEYGFGLGLELVAQICHRFGWQCVTTEHPGGRNTTIRF